MADTKRQRIVDAVKARLETIRTGHTVAMHSGRTHTYVCNLRDSVYSWKTAPTQSIDIPGVNVKDTQSSTSLAIQAHGHALRVHIEAFATTAEELRALIGDITACIGSDLTWGGLADDTKPIGDEDISVVQKGAVVAGCSMPILIEFSTDPWDPFT